MKRRSSLDAGFDTYLSRELHQLYDPVLGEAIPDEMAALLRGFAPPSRTTTTWGGRRRPDPDVGGGAKGWIEGAAGAALPPRRRRHGSGRGASLGGGE
jgi:hypothetical protein